MTSFKVNEYKELAVSDSCSSTKVSVQAEMRCRQLISDIDIALDEALKELPIQQPPYSKRAIEMDMDRMQFTIEKLRVIQLPTPPSWSGAACWLGTAPRMLIAQRGQLQLLNLDLEEEEHIELSGETPITGVLGQIEALGGLYLALGHASGRVDILDPWGHRLYRTSLSASITSMALVKEQQDAIWVVGNRSGELIALDQGQIRWRIDTMDYLNTCRKTFPNSCVKSRHNGIIAMVSAWLPLNYASTDLQHQLIVSSSAFPDVLTSVLAGKIIWTAGTPARVNTMAVGYFDTSLGAISTCEQVVAGCEDGAIYLMDAMLSSNDVSFKQLAQLRQPIRQLVAMPLAFHSTESTMMIACVTLTNTLTLVRNGMIQCQIETSDWIHYASIPLNTNTTVKNNGQEPMIADNLLTISMANGKVGWYRVNITDTIESSV